MLNTIYGQKKNMSQSFEPGVRTPVTQIKLEPCVVTQIKIGQKDRYWSIQLGFGTKKTKSLTKPEVGHLKGAKIGKSAPRFLREVRLSEEDFKSLSLKVGDKVTVSDVLKKGDMITITSKSKGKGFAGVVKRWGFAGGPKTHGQSDRHRAPGSIGSGGTTPGRVLKGKKMAGRMGGKTIAIKNLKVIETDSESNLLTVSGPIAGSPGTPLKITVSKHFVAKKQK